MTSPSSLLNVRNRRGEASADRISGLFSLSPADASPLHYLHPRPQIEQLPPFTVFYHRIKERVAPAEQPFGVLVAHVDAALAHGSPKIVVPVGAVKRDACRVEECDPGDPDQLVGV